MEKGEESEGRPAACAGWPGCLSLAGVYDGNSSSVNESNLVSMWLHLEEPYRGPAAEAAGWSIEWRSTGVGTA